MTDCKFRIFPSALLFFLAFAHVSNVISESLNPMRVQLESPKEKERISISFEPREGENEEGGGGGEDDLGGGKPPAESTSFEECQGKRCCYQYTWPGVMAEDKIPKPENNTCEWWKENSKDDTMACFDPLVYTDGKNNSGNRPDIQALLKEAQDRNLNIFCDLTQTCVKYTFYSNDGKNSVRNETRFCGSVSNSNSGDMLKKGCFRQKVGGYTKEVCVCEDKDLCNSSQQIALSSWIAMFQLCSILYLTRTLSWG